MRSAASPGSRSPHRHAELVSASIKPHARWVEKNPCVYILSSRPYGTLYIGVTSDLVARLWQHRSGEVKGFTSRYSVHRLVRFEQFGSMADAIEREKQLKRWRRQWKINLIESENPDWHDLAPALGLPAIAEPGATMDAETSSA